MNMVKKKKYEMDLTNGNFFKKILLFSIPLILSGVLQLLYSTADLLIVGDDAAVAAIGSTGSLISLCINLFMGLSVGANVLTARCFAVNDKERLSKTVHTSVSVSVIIGTFLSIIGVIFAETFLGLMNNPVPMATTYLRIYFIGMPFNLLYNFCASILRGIGDTKRPLAYLSFSGAINVLLNLIFVYVFKMKVEGVAIATVTSQILSSFLIMRCLIKTKEAYGFSFKKIAIHKKELIEIIKVGLPAGVQGTLFAISNVIIQSSVNQYGKIILSGNSAAVDIGGYVYTVMIALSNAAVSFVGQNMGVKKYENIKKVVGYCLLIVTILGLITGVPAFLLGKQLGKLYSLSPLGIDTMYLRLFYLCVPYFTCGIMDVMVGVLRGMGKSFVPMATSIIGICGFRVVWIYTVFKALVDYNDYHTLRYLYMSYPISWVLTFAAHFIMFVIIYKKITKNHQMEIVNANN